MGKKDLDLSEFGEAREEFSLRDRLAGVSRRRKTVTIYTDDQVGSELGYAKDEVLTGGIKTGNRIRKGIVGEMDELEARSQSIIQRLDAEEAAGLDPSEKLNAEVLEIAEKVKAFAPRIAELRKKLDKSALIFTLHAVPDVVIRDVRRQARQALDIKGKGIPESKTEEYAYEYIAHLLVASTIGWEDKLADEKHSSLTLQQARDLRDYLPFGQFDRLDVAIGELSFQSAIDNSLSDSADF